MEEVTIKLEQKQTQIDKKETEKAYSNTDAEYACDLCKRLYSKSLKFCPFCGFGG
jgi:rRNA maturation endonuclease Nob1